MEIASIIPAIKIVKESTMAGCDMYVSIGDSIRVSDCDGRVFVGKFLYMEFGKDEEEDDLIVLDIDGENVTIQCSWITDIEEV